jgi:hypothetical protein
MRASSILSSLALSVSSWLLLNVFIARNQAYSGPHALGRSGVRVSG